MNSALKFLAFSAYCLNAGLASASTSTLTLALEQRLALMQDVAAYKWVNSIAIEDKARETLVISKAVEAALRVGIKPETSKSLFEVQILAAKEIQAYWFSKWRVGHAPLRAPDLVSELRPKLLALGEKIVFSLNASPDLRWQAFNHSINVEGLSPQTKNLLFLALANIQAFPNRLNQIVETGQIRIGTTGDYAPFSISESTDTQFSGIDITLGRNLALALKVKAVFVQTSWPKLMSDLQAGKFDIAMSGVSRTLERQALGYFSEAYFVGGKTPIVRCDDQSRFDSLKKIDQQNVRLIVNPGGTNQKFIAQHIKNANVRVHDDNRSIFNELVQFKADVMITDRIEVTYQVTRHQQLCAAMTSDLSYQEKAYLMPQDAVFLNYVNTWLHLRKSEGLIDKLFQNLATH